MRLISLTTATVENKVNTQLTFIKKALFMSAFFISLILPTQCVFSYSCTSDGLSAPEKAKVKFVYDGDTLLLTDKRKIRIIGVDTPETKHHKQKEQAYAAKATEALRELLKRFHNQVSLQYGAQRKDRYSRILAHVFLADGTNISNWLLERGFAKTLAIPPNIKLANCYKTVEEDAQIQSLRIWKLPSNQIKDATTLTQRFKGYVRLRGQVNKIKHTKKSLLIELESNAKRRIQVKIQKRNLHYFTDIDLSDLLAETIVVTGRLKNKYGKQIIYLNHPSQLEFPKVSYSSINKETHNSRNQNSIAPTIEWSK